MAGMIKSIFGLTPAQQQEEYLKQQRALAAQLTRQGTNSAVAQFGTGLGAALGRGLMSRMGIEDPAMVKAQQNLEAQEELNKRLEGASPEASLRELARVYMEMGDTATAASYLKQAQDLETSKTQLDLAREAGKRSERDLQRKEKKTEAEIAALTAKKTEPETPLTAPAVASSTAVKNINRILDQADYGLKAEVRDRLAPELAQRLETAKKEHKIAQEESGKRMEWMGDEKAVDIIIQDMKETGILEEEFDTGLIPEFSIFGKKFADDKKVLRYK